MLWLASTAASPPRGAPTALAAPKFGENCPAGSQQRVPGWPHGILYNHISTTGGTTMKGLLRDVMGTHRPHNSVNSDDNRRDWNVTYVSEPFHVQGNDTQLIGADGALVVEEDVHHDLRVRHATPPHLCVYAAHATAPTLQPPHRCSRLTPTLAASQVTADDAANFFVIGVVRRPCDYMVSRWAKSSETKRAKNATRAAAEAFWGETPPYNSSAGELITHPNTHRRHKTPRERRTEPCAPHTNSRATPAFTLLYTRPSPPRSPTQISSASAAGSTPPSTGATPAAASTTATGCRSCLRRCGSVSRTRASCTAGCARTRCTTT